MKNIFTAILGISIVAALVLYFQRLDTAKIDSNVAVKQLEVKMEMNDFNEEFSKSLASMSETKEEKEFHENKSKIAKEKNVAIQKKAERANKRREKLRKISDDNFDDIEKEMKAFNSKTDKEFESNNMNF